MTQDTYDVIFAGGGLSATLAAYRLKQTRPRTKLLIVEAGERLGGNHTWSFHDTDIGEDARGWVAPFVSHRWPKQKVHFPRYERVLPLGYNTIFSEQLHEAAMPLLDGSVLFGERAEAVEPDHVKLEDGRTLSAPCVVDARGQGNGAGLTLGYQKFVGLEVRFEKPHGELYPTIMDATVPQRDGYRFLYTLPYSADRMLIEDTYYSDTALLDEAFLRAECLHYAQKRGWAVAEVIRQEKGVLPIVLSGSVDALLEQKPRGVPTLGLRAGFFHHTTSYSFPLAVKCAEAIAKMDRLTSERLDRTLTGWAHRHWDEQRFFRLLNRMLFWAAKPERRYRVLERFYALREPLIGRFYSGSLTLADQARILAGRPPVPIGRALRVLGETRSNPIAQPASSAG